MNDLTTPTESIPPGVLTLLVDTAKESKDLSLANKGALASITGQLAAVADDVSTVHACLFDIPEGMVVRVARIEDRLNGHYGPPLPRQHPPPDSPAQGNGITFKWILEKVSLPLGFAVMSFFSSIIGGLVIYYLLN